MSANLEAPPRIRVLIIDDSAFMRTALSRMIAAEPDLEVVATAGCASDALRKIPALDPDVVTLDVAMPGLDGLATLGCIMRQSPRPVIMVSATTEKDAKITFDALSAGAFDYIPKQMSPASLDITHIRSDLVAKVRAAAQSRSTGCSAPHSRESSQSAPLETPGLPPPDPLVVAIGLSTGGPRALERILSRLPQDFPVPILIVQHMPVGFTGPFAQRLDSMCAITVREAVQRELVQPGIAYIAPAGFHMCVVPRVPDSKPMIALGHHPDSMHIPSVDVLMKSVAEVFRNRAMGVIMTGMGSDGAEGMAAIHRQGGFTLGQDESTCAVYGMPRVCAELGVLNRVVPLSDIPKQILQATRRRKRA